MCLTCERALDALSAVYGLELAFHLLVEETPYPVAPPTWAQVQQLTGPWD